VAHASDPVAAYRTHGPALVRKAERILLNPDDARDVVHAVFTDMMARGNQQSDLPYLYRAVGSRCINLLRDRRNRQRLLAAQESSLRGVVRSRCDEHVVSLDLLSKLSEQLDARTMEIMVCLFVDDMTQDEAAALLGVSRKTVGKRVARIRAALADLVGASAAEEVG
jgi:RNA polymerase sigma-70 factor (ECF subfamily)